MKYSLRSLKWDAPKTNVSYSTSHKREPIYKHCWLVVVVGVEQGKTTSIRGLYYLLKHTIDGTREETFNDQGDCDGDRRCRSYTQRPSGRAACLCLNRGSMVGNIGNRLNRYEIDCSRMGSGGYDPFHRRRSNAIREV